MFSILLGRSVHCLVRPFILLCVTVLVILQAAMTRPAVATPDGVENGSIPVTTLLINGLVHTKEETIRQLLPRAVPGNFTSAELEEFERRIRNLSLFDRVAVAAQDGHVTVDVQEKVTLSPILSFTSGTSVKDLNATAGLVEYNVGGTGTQIGGQFNYSSEDRMWTCGFQNMPTDRAAGRKK